MTIKNGIATLFPNILGYKELASSLVHPFLGLSGSFSEREIVNISQVAV